ncbi:MAG: hypothetical protein J6S69_02655, partial [Proteobacteria bacterium]|nr:hypothetical protein [Pseudomonadota bacterium]
KNRLCDYNALIALFKAQSQNQTPSFIKSLYKFGTTDFKDITYLCQDCSYEVWQNLDIYNLPESIKFWNGKTETIELISDALRIPTQAIRRSYNIQNNRFQGLSSHSVQGLSAKEKFFGPNYRHLKVFIFALIWMLIKNLDSCSYTPSPSSILSPKSAAFQCIPVISIVLIGVALISLALYQLYFKKDNNKDAAKETTPSFDLSSPFTSIKVAKPTPQVHKKLEYTQTLKQGVKAVGRIIDIYYQATQANAIEIIDSRGDVKDVTNETVLGSPILFVHHPPRFLISYQFQIDGKSLLGQLVTSTPPEDHYKIGDFITLVVNMDIGKPGKFLAVPYPYPLDNMTSPDDIIYEGDINTLNEDIVYL